MSALTLVQRRRVAALMKARSGEYLNLLAHESDLDVLRQLNYQSARWASTDRGAMLAERLFQLTGRRPNTGRGQGFALRGTLKKEAA